MTKTQSKIRLQDENSFSQTQNEFFAHGHALEELTSTVDAREAKTIRLREARLAKEQGDRAAATKALATARARKP